MRAGLNIVAPRPRAQARESIVPMINVVFLLLIFFLMTAEIAPPEALDVLPPEAAAGAQPGGGTALLIAADGSIAFGTARGEAVWAALAVSAAGDTLVVRADARLPGAALAALLPRLAEAGVARLHLVTVGG